MKRKLAVAIGAAIVLVAAVVVALTRDGDESRPDPTAAVTSDLVDVSPPLRDLEGGPPAPPLEQVIEHAREAAREAEPGGESEEEREREAEAEREREAEADGDTDADADAGAAVPADPDRPQTEEEPDPEEEDLERPPVLPSPRDGLTPLPDPVVQADLGPSDTSLGPSAPLPSIPSAAVSFDGIANAANPTKPNTVTPPDTNGEVGPNHYVQAVNFSLAVYDKSGRLAAGFPKALNALWAGFGNGAPCQNINSGDPIILYDQLADRWFLSQFALPNYPQGPFYECVAVSTTGDPTGSWFRYQFTFSTTVLNDFPKFAVWPNAYVATFNQYQGSSFLGVAVAAYDRSAMLQGRPASVVTRALVSPSFAALPADVDGLTPPPAGSPAIIAEVRDDNLGAAADQLLLYGFNVDFANPAASTLGPLATLTPAPFDGNLCNLARACIPQRGVSNTIDPVAARLNFRLAYRNLGSSQALAATQTVDADGRDRGGVRWYDLRNTGSGWRINDQGTYAPAGESRFVSTIAMDRDGDIALGYSVSSASTFPSIRYTGRLATDPPGQMPQGEATLQAGAGAQTAQGNRWGDYADLSLDPTDDCTFWLTSQYYASTSATGWRTRIGSFRFPSCGTGTPPPTTTTAGATTTTTGPTTTTSGATTTSAGATTTTTGPTTTTAATTTSTAATTTTAPTTTTTQPTTTTGPKLTISLSPTAASITEGNSGTRTLSLAINLSAPATGTIGFSYTTANGTATAGSDYLARSGTASFAKGVRTRTATITVNGDRTREPNETFTFTVTGAAGTGVGAATATITIVNDD